MSSHQSDNVLLGFAEEQEGWLLKSKFFPSKIGQHPAWLDLQNIPDAKELTCEYCNEPCIFLCQVYAVSEVVPHAFHRTVFVFICKNGQCCSLNNSGNIKVFRSQLRLQNAFYPDKPADDSQPGEDIEMPVKICRVCGCRGPLMCGKCKTVSYCGQVHQKLDWKIHKHSCGAQNPVKPATNEILFSEFEIVIEQEEQQQVGKKELEKEAEKRRLREYEEMVKSGQAGAMNTVADADFNEFDESKEDKTFGKFKKSIESYETQVIRYNRHGSPLWISDHGILNTSHVPICPLCKGRRTFEFQIMPQMLNELKNYDLDWGIIAVYTCEKDCDIDGKYVAEFCYKQDIVKSEEDEKAVDLEKLRIMEENAMDVQELPQELPASNKTSNNQQQKPSQKKKKAPVSQPKPKAFEENDNWE